MKKDSKLYTVVFTFIITFAFVALLALANEGTKEQIARNNELFFRRAVLNAMNIPFDTQTQAYDLFDEMIHQRETVEGIVFETELDGEKRYAIQFTGNGLWGTITGIVAVNADASRIAGIDFIDQNETPGLGGRIEEPWFKEQFRGEAIPEGRIRMLRSGGRTGDPDPDNAAVDAVTGATQTSDSVERIINTYLQKLRSVLGVTES